MADVDQQAEELSTVDEEETRTTIVPVIGVGVCAASLSSLETLFTGIGAALGAAHLIAVRQKEGLDVGTVIDVLKRVSPLPVGVAEHGEAIEPNRIYVAGPDDMIGIEDGHLHVWTTDEPIGHRGTVDTMLVSLAEHAHDRSVAVLLGGLGSDGTAGVTATKKFGGLSIAEAHSGDDDHVAQGVAGPLGVVDLHLPIDGIAAQIARYLNNLAAADGMPDPEETAEETEARIAEIVTILRKVVGHDFHGYKRGTFLRRVHRRMQVLQIDTLPAYVERLRDDRQEVQDLFQDLLIGVTQFFRDPAEFDVLERELPRLFEGKGPGDQFRVWVLGCATGEEAYSIAILLRERMATMDEPPRVQIFATDLDARALGLARAGRYAASIENHVRSDRLARWFVREGDTYCVSKDLREMCIFSPHNVIKDAPFSRVDILSCRNLLIYLTTELQSRVIPIFHFSLVSGGVLFLGNSENITRHGKLFAPVDRKNRVFRRLETATRIIPDFPLSPRARVAEALPASASPTAPRLSGMLGRQAEAVAERYAPAYVIVDTQGDVLHFSGRTGRYLEPVAGVASLNVINLVHRDLRVELRSALGRAIADARRVELPRLALQRDDGATAVNLIVEPMGTTAVTSLMILFQDAGLIADGTDGDRLEDGEQVERLEAELRLTRDRLQATIEELESTNEELKSSNEEYQSINEELQSASEEMETSKEELQSVNEELQTVNGELGHRVSELGRANSDLKNLLEATQIATLFLDNDLRVRSFTPSATEVFHLLDTDVGRPLGHVVSRVGYPELGDDARRVLKTLVPVDRTVLDPQNGRHFAARVLPYRSVDNYISGTVVTFTDLTAVREAETALRASETRYEALFAASPVPFLAVAPNAPDFTITAVNDAYLAATHSTREMLVGRNLLDMFVYDPEDPGKQGSAEVARSLERVLATGQTDVMERIRYDITTPEGEVEPQWWLAINAPMFDADGNVIAIIHQARLVTEQFYAEQAARESEERQAFLLKLADETGEQTDAEAVAATTCRLLAEQIDASRVQYLVVEGSPGEEVGEAIGEHVRRGRALPRYFPFTAYGEEPVSILRASQTLVIEDVETDPRIASVERDTWRSVDVRAAVCATLVKGGRITGTLAIQDDKPRKWTQQDVALVQGVAERTWTSLERARAEAALRESEARFRAIAEQAVDYAIFTTDAAGRIDSWQPGAAAVFGWSAEEAIGRDAVMLWTPEDLAAGDDEKEFRQAQETGMAPDVRWHLRKDGSRVFIDGVSRGRRGPGGEAGGILKIGRDMSDRHRAEEVLRDSEERFRQFGEASTDIVWVRDAATLDFEYVSPAFETIYGRAREEVGREVDRWTSILHPEDRERVRANFERVRGGERVTHEFRILRPDGGVRWLEDLDFPLRDETGRITRIGGIGHDITAGKLAADALRDSEERFRSFADASEDVLWIVDAATRELEYVSPAYEHIWGEPRAAVMADLGAWAARIHPEDLPAPGEGLDALFEGRSFTADYRVQRQDGTTRFVRDTGFPIYGEDGRIRRLAGIAQDLTERRAAERALADSDRRTRTLMEGIPQLVWRSCDKGLWTWSSPQWLDFTGQTQVQSLGRGWMEALHPDDRDVAMRAWEAAFPTGRLDVEYRVRRARDRAYVWHHTRSVPVRDEGGRIVEWLGTTTDVHALREMRERQTVMVAELQHRTRNLITVVSALSRQTLKSSGSLADFDQHFAGRLSALSRVQGLLSHLSAGERVTFDELLRSELKALGAPDDKLTLDGPGGVPLRSGTVQTFSLALHELATNALKYGALSAPGGHLTVRWGVTHPDGDGPRLQVDWRESGVDMTHVGERPAGGGYGRELIEHALPYQLDADTTYEMTGDGVHCTIDVPASAATAKED